MSEVEEVRRCVGPHSPLLHSPTPLMLGNRGNTQVLPLAPRLFPSPDCCRAFHCLHHRYLAGVGGGVAATREVMSPESGPLPWRAPGEAWPCRALAIRWPWGQGPLSTGGHRGTVWLPSRVLLHKGPNSPCAPVSTDLCLAGLSCLE